MSLRDRVGDGGIDAVRLLAHEGFAGELQQNASIRGDGADPCGAADIGADYIPGGFRTTNVP